MHLNEEDIKNELACPICAETYRDPSILPCGLCQYCIRNMCVQISHLKCPWCRENHLEPEKGGFNRNLAIAKLIDKNPSLVYEESKAEQLIQCVHNHPAQLLDQLVDYETKRSVNNKAKQFLDRDGMFIDEAFARNKDGELNEIENSEIDKRTKEAEELLRLVHEMLQVKKSADNDGQIIIELWRVFFLILRELLQKFKKKSVTKFEQFWRNTEKSFHEFGRNTEKGFKKFGKDTETFFKGVNTSINDIKNDLLKKLNKK